MHHWRLWHPRGHYSLVAGSSWKTFEITAFYAKFDEMSIQPNELRIGNLVYASWKTGLIVPIKEIREFKIIVDDDEWSCLKYDEIDPIPLTPEWLEKCGFEKRLEYWEPFVGDAKGAWFNMNGIFIVVLKSNGKIYRAIATNGDEFGYVDGPEIKSVHQLQNVIFALTGQELDIKEKV